MVLENGRVRLSGTGHEVLNHPEIGALYLGGAVSDKATPEPGRETGRRDGPPSRTSESAANGTAPGAAR